MTRKYEKNFGCKGTDNEVHRFMSVFIYSTPTEKP